MVADDNGGASALPPPPPCYARAVAALIYPIRRLIDFFFFDAFQPKDTFMIKVRKVVSGALAVATLSFITNLLDFVNSMMDPNLTYEKMMYAYLEFGIYDVFSIIPMCFAFAYTRYTKTAPDWAIGVPGICLLISTVFYALGTATIDLVGSAIVLNAVISVSNLGRVWFVAGMILSCLILIVNCLNLSRTVPLLIPGARMPYEPQSVFNYISAQGFQFLIASFFLYAVVRESDVMIVKAQGAERFSTQLASCLQRYDTTAARELLKRCSSSATKTSSSYPMENDSSQRRNSTTNDSVFIIDAALLEAFTGIVRNLERYRPHLPNYLLEQPASEGGGGRGGSVDGGMFDDVQMHDVSVDGSDSTAENPLDTTATVQASSGASPTLPGAAARATFADTPSPSAAVMMGGGAVAVRSMTNFIDSSFRGMVDSKVAVTLVDIVVPEGRLDRKYALDRIVGSVCTAAAATQGSVHGFIGDRLVATWNATKRVAKPESRAARFALRLQTALSREGVSMASMTATGFAESCFAGDHRLQLFMCTSKLLWDVTTAGLNRTRHLRVAAMDDATKEQASVDVRSRGLTLLKHVAAQRSEVCIYELIAELDDLDDLEWMYKLERHEGGPDELISDALRLYAASHVEEALSTMRKALTISTSEPSQGMRDLLTEMELELARRDQTA